MEYEQIRALRLAHPFRPFNLVLNDGRCLPVDQPYYLGISPTKRFVTLSTFGEDYEVVRLERIRSVDFHGDKSAPGADASGGNGNRGR